MVSEHEELMSITIINFSHYEKDRGVRTHVESVFFGIIEHLQRHLNLHILADFTQIQANFLTSQRVAVTQEDHV